MSDVVVVNVTTPPQVQVVSATTGGGNTTVGVNANTIEQIEPYTLHFPSTLVTFNGQNPLYLEGPYSLSSVRFSLGAPSTSGAVIVDLLCNEVSIFGGAKPTIPQNEKTVLATNLATKATFAKGDSLTVSIIDPGLTQTAGDLTVTLRLKRLF